MKQNRLISFLNEANHPLLILDGATGTLIEEQGYRTNSPLWSAEVLERNPQVVHKIHKQYFKSGADIITANTFRTTAYYAAKIGKKSNFALKLMKKAISIAHDAKIVSKSVGFIFGSIAPLEDCFKPNLCPSDEILYNYHTKTILNMDTFSEIDLLLFETQNNIREIFTVSNIISDNNIDHPCGLSITLNHNGLLLDGTDWKTLKKIIKEDNFKIIGINCVSPNLMGKGLSELAHLELNIPIIAYANIGYADHDPNIKQSLNKYNPLKYYLETQKWVEKYKISILGACCGSNPEYITQLSNNFRRNSLPYL